MTAHDPTDEARTRNAFMARISHDLRSPLNAIVGFAELMYHGKVGAISDEQKEYLGDILTSSRHLLILINDVLDLAKVEAGKMAFHPEKINLGKVLNETPTVFQHLITSKKIDFQLRVDPSLTQIIIDPVRLKQVIYNFVSNALKCTPDGGHVTLHVVPETKTTFRLEVEDDGIGIRPEDLNRLFVEFQQLDRTVAKTYPSSGLGLALTKHIVESQGGTIGVNSTFGKGSRFYAIFPNISLLNEDTRDGA